MSSGSLLLSMNLSTVTGVQVRSSSFIHSLIILSLDFIDAASFHIPCVASERHRLPDWVSIRTQNYMLIAVVPQKRIICHKIQRSPTHNFLFLCVSMFSFVPSDWYALDKVHFPAPITHSNHNLQTKTIILLHRAFIVLCSETLAFVDRS